MGGISVTPYGAEKVMQQQWPCLSFSWGTCAAPWDFSWQADVVTINLGTNDYVFGSLTPLQYTCGGAQWGAQDPKWQPMVDGVQNAVQSLQQAGDQRVLFHATGSTDAPWLSCLGDYSDQT